MDVRRRQRDTSDGDVGVVRKLHEAPSGIDRKLHEAPSGIELHPVLSFTHPKCS
jgi:hypothetical protein